VSERVLLTAEALAQKWPVESYDPCIRWSRMLRKWRESEPPWRTSQGRYELVYRDGFAVYVYSEPRVLRLTRQLKAIVCQSLERRTSI
jgi:hypothetical protein